MHPARPRGNGGSNMHRAVAIITACAAVSSTALAQPPAPLWNITFGGVGVWANAAASDLAGGVYVVGDAPSGPSNDAFLNRFSPSGELIFTRLFGTVNQHEEGRAVCVTPEAVFVTGTVLAGSYPNWHYDVFITRLTRDGEVVWHRTFGSSTSEFANDLCSDGAGGVFIVGDTLGSLAAPHLGAYDGFLAHYDGDGNQLWIRQFGTPQLEYTTAAYPDGAGGVYIAGDTAGTLGLASSGGIDCWLARYDSSGERLWIRQFGTFMSDGIMDLCSDGAGGLYAAGWTFGDFGGQAAGGRDAFVARLTADGEIIWARQLGTLYPELAEAVSPDGKGGVYVFGYTSGSLAAPFLGGSRDLFLAHYNASGVLSWVRQFGTDVTDYPRSAAPDAAGGVYIAGRRQYSTNGGQISTLARFPGCYANCDDSSHAPLLNVGDFTCFLQKFAAAEPYANCDNSTTPPVLNILDFVCFLQKFAAGCPG
jgi:hypothetical protein